MSIGVLVALGAGCEGTIGLNGFEPAGLAAGDPPLLAAETLPPALAEAPSFRNAPSSEPSASVAPAGRAGSGRVWSPLSVLALVNPLDYGAIGDGVADDLPALRASVAALPRAGGVVYLPAGRSFRKTGVWEITADHVKLWSVNRSAEVFSSIAGQRRKQAIVCRASQGCGVFGLALRSDARARFDALEDNQLAADRASLVEIVGNDIDGSAATGVFLFGSSEHYIEGNYVHHTWADHIHHTHGASGSWVWNNTIFNQAPSKGDDGIACVTYGADAKRCSDMEWWQNVIFHTDWGRGYSVIGGENIAIHDNWALGVAGAGVIVASESAFDTASSRNISIHRNYVQACGHTIKHPGLLVSGRAYGAGPLSDIALEGNVSVDSPNGPYRAEGAYQNLTNTDMRTTSSALPAPPSRTSVRLADTRVLRTRDVSHVPARFRPGLFRIHLRANPDGAGFQQRFEYVVRGLPAFVLAFLAARTAAGDHVSEQRRLTGSAYALLLTAAPVSLPAGVSGVSFRELRVRARSSELRWLWERVDAGQY